MGNRVIYQPMYDAEVEYLESDGNSYIDTGLKASSELGILAEIQNTSDSSVTGWAFGGSNAPFSKDFGFLVNGSRRESSFRFSDSSMSISTPFVNTVKTTFNNIENHNVLKVGNTTYEAPLSTFTSDFNLYLFASNKSGVLQGQHANIRIYSFKIYQNSTLVRDFIPVRIGQIGYLYDKVTKQLFANKGTGQFILGSDVSNAVIPQQRCVLYFGSQRSVIYERIYEEYEWLNSVSGSEYIQVAGESNTDSNAYIRTTYKCNYNSRNRDITIGGSKNVSNNQSIRIFNTSNTTYIDVHKWTNGTQTSFRKTVSGGQSGVERSLYVTLTNWQVDNQSGTVTLGTAFDTVYDYQATRLIFQNSSYAYKRTQMRTNNKEFDLIPCKLLQPIPAILDGNGIARQAVECGMWDKKNNRFYGNVANTGSFTVSND